MDGSDGVRPDGLGRGGHPHELLALHRLQHWLLLLSWLPSVQHQPAHGGAGPLPQPPSGRSGHQPDRRPVRGQRIRPWRRGDLQLLPVLREQLRGWRVLQQLRPQNRWASQLRFCAHRQAELQRQRRLRGFPGPDAVEQQRLQRDSSERLPWPGRSTERPVERRLPGLQPGAVQHL